MNPTVLKDAKQDILLEYTYPRLDVEVSKHLNHLLKSPFCVHPGTGRVCVPIDATRVTEFNPEDVPTVTQLLREMDQWKPTDSKEEGIRGAQDGDRTSLKPYINFFKSFVHSLAGENKPVKREREDSMEF